MAAADPPAGAVTGTAYDFLPLQTVFAVPCTVAIAFGLAAWGSFAWLAGMSSVVRLAVYVLSIACLPVLRRKLGPPPVRLPGGYAIPVIAIVVCLWLLAQVTLRPVLVTLAFLAAGTALYALAPAARRRRNDGPDADR